MKPTPSSSGPELDAAASGRLEFEEDADILPTEEDVTIALECSPNSAPGPDLVPFCALRKLKKIVVPLISALIWCLA